jgi:hypothetical protein
MRRHEIPSAARNQPGRSEQGIRGASVDSSLRSELVPRLLRLSSMPEQNEQPDDQISKKVIYEHVTTSGTNREFIIVVIVLAVIALVLVGWILMHLHR